MTPPPRPTEMPAAGPAAAGDGGALPASLLRFFDGLSEPLWVLASDGRITHANAMALRWLGVEAGSLLPQWRDVFGPEGLEWVARQMAGAPAPGPAPILELAGQRRAALAWHPLWGGWSTLRLTWQGGGVDTQFDRGPDTSPSGLARGVLSRSSGDLIRLFWDSPFPVTLQDGDFRLVELNPAYAQFVGRPRDALIGRDPIDFAPPDDRDTWLAVRTRLRTDPETVEVPLLVERRVLDADGRERWFRLSRRWLRDEQGRPMLLAVMQDCTAEHVARERAERSMRELDQWFDLSTVGMVLFDSAGLLVRTNPAFEHLVGDVPVQLSDAPAGLQQLLGWSAAGPPAQLQPGASVLHGDSVMELPGGALRRLKSVVRCYATAAGQRRYLAVVEDRSAEEERDIAQIQIGALMDTAGVGLATFEETLGWLPQPASAIAAAQASARASEARTSSAVLQSISRDMVIPDSLPHYDRLQQALRQARRAEVRYAIRHPVLGLRWLLTRVEPATLASGKRTTSVVTLDVTETQRAQARSEQLLRELTTILESTTAGIAYLRGDLLVRCNPRFEAMLGVGGGKVIGASVQELFGRHPQARRIAREASQALATGGVYETEFEFDLGRDGSSAADGAEPLARWYSLSVRQASGAGEVAESIAVLTDITRLKTQQRDLELLARDRELMFSLSDVGIAFIRGDRIQRANLALAQMAGYGSEELALLPVDRLFPNLDEFDRLWVDEAESLRSDGRWTGERQLRRRDGRLLWVQVSKRLVVEGQPSAGLIASYVNVDDRHRAEEAVAVQMERTRAILDSVLVGIVTVGGGGIEWMNRSARRMFGGDLADFVGQPIGTVATPDPDHPFRQAQYLEELLEGQAETFECQVKARDGREFWVVGNVVATGQVNDGHGPRGRQLTYALLDIERRRQAEARILETRATLQRIIEAAPLAILLLDAASLAIQQANQTAEQFTGVAVPELIGRRPDELGASAEAWWRDARAALEAGSIAQHEVRLGSGDEQRLWETRFVPVDTGAGPGQLLVVATDVTTQRQAQQARFEAALAQREMLVREVHHRIKNNLQGVAGLMQQIAQRKPEVAATMEEVIGQVQAIAQVYGLQVGAGGLLHLRPVVEAITGSVERTFGRVIELGIEASGVDEWVLPEAESIPIALTVNELLTNAIKHSPAGSTLRCTIDAEPGGVRLAIANQGRLPEGFSPTRFPMGVSGIGLIRALLPRRSADLSYGQVGDRVVATLRLQPPGVIRENAAA
ncbi:MAG: PAS domain S-box protein [Ideonella sp.]|nr:PAS domain S-box protein [Ideonella sp.]